MAKFTGKRITWEKEEDVKTITEQLKQGKNRNQIFLSHFSTLPQQRFNAKFKEWLDTAVIDNALVDRLGNP